MVCYCLISYIVVFAVYIIKYDEIEKNDEPLVLCTLGVIVSPAVFPFLLIILIILGLFCLVVNSAKWVRKRIEIKWRG
jgi:hypothetical protein